MNLQILTGVGEKKTTRRNALRLGAASIGFGLLTKKGLLPEAQAAGTDVLLLSCMDFRLMDDVQKYMAGRGMVDKYDHVVLAGASLGATTDKYPAWNTTFWDHLDIAIKLHNIHTVLVMDHRDCGAYKVILGPDHAKEGKLERDTHATHLKNLKTAILKKYPKLKVETALMSLDGKVETIA